MNAPVYEARGLQFRYDPRRRILDGVDLAVEPGEFLGLLGSNGAGKSTLLGLLTARLLPSGGDLVFRGRNVADWPARELARHVAVVPQREETVFPFTAREVVLMGRYPHIGGFLGFESKHDFDIADEALDRVDMGGFADAPMTQLSGGERQLVLVARALAQQPEVLLLDEPTSALDLCHKQMIYELLESLNREHGTTIVTVSHDLNIASIYCRNLALLHDGRIAARGAPRDVLSEERLRQVFKVSLQVGRTSQGYPLVSFQKKEAVHG